MKKLENTFEVVLSAVPSVALGFVTAWYDLLRDTALVRPDIPNLVSNMAIAIGALLTVFLVLIGREWPPGYKAVLGKRSLTVGVILALCCYGFRLFLSYPRNRFVQGVVTNVWDLFAWVCIVAFILAVTFASMYALSSWAKDAEEE
ncbi:hypothetical protein [Mesorhizobium sp. NZP2077]|uniref:hypothetical protein n=1 Tax=Mesorhizobium sp. NZP2077 TaxID=2483404 RepID=UPI0015535FAC|nr:hypothetical protein [Mesorhizobium sp. NZP2077]QKC82802.1 hypothetical protein EB232_15335 [Mesorhizobium sp. NZP2077]QKD16299.1 hypothetical protein HGP13_15135 [Mesorhizobium sp. NZP2077]